MFKEDYVYSYVERKVINIKESHKFDEKRCEINKNDDKSIFVAILLGSFLGAIVLAIFIIKDILLF